MRKKSFYDTEFNPVEENAEFVLCRISGIKDDCVQSCIPKEGDYAVKPDSPDGLGFGLTLLEYSIDPSFRVVHQDRDFRDPNGIVKGSLKLVYNVVHPLRLRRRGTEDDTEGHDLFSFRQKLNGL